MGNKKILTAVLIMAVILLYSCSEITNVKSGIIVDVVSVDGIVGAIPEPVDTNKVYAVTCGKTFKIKKKLTLERTLNIPGKLLANYSGMVELPVYIQLDWSDKNDARLRYYINDAIVYDNAITDALKQRLIDAFLEEVN